MKKLLYALVAIVVLIVAAAIVAPSLIDWNSYRDHIAARVQQATGRAVTIDGDLNLTVLPSPAFSADGVRIANVAGGSAPAMATLRALRVKIRLAPLLQGRVEVEQVVLVEPRLLLEVLPDGRTNWLFGGAAKATGDKAEQGAGDGIAVRLDSVRIVDGAVVYRDHIRDREESVRGVDAEITAESLSGPFEGRGELVARGIPLRFDAAIGRYNPEGPTRFQLALALPGADARSSLAGTLDIAHEDGPVLAGTLEADGDNLARVVQAAGGGTPLPPQLAQAFAVSATLEAQRTRLEAANLDLRLGETSADGGLEVTFAETPQAAIALHAQRLDLDDLLAMKGAAADAPAPDGGGAGLPKGLEARLDLRVDALVYRGQVVRQARVDAVLEEGMLKLRHAMALLPGGSDVAVSGTLVGGPRFDGRVEAASDNLRAVFDWLGVTVDEVPAGRLRRMSLLAGVSWAPGQMTLSDVDAEIDTMQVSGGIAVALRRRPGIGVGLSFDRLNLDAYLADGKPSGTQGGEAAGPDALAVLGGFDANFDLKAGVLTWRGETARDLRFKGTLQQGRLTVREARIGDLAGSRVSVDGTAGGLLAGQPALDVNLTIESRKPERLVRLFHGTFEMPAELGAMTLSGNVKGEPADLAVDLTFDALDGLVQARGGVQPLPGPAALDLAVTFRHPDLAGLLRRLPGEMDGQRDLGGVDLSVRIAGTPLRLQATDLRGTLGPVVVSGTASADMTEPRPMIRASLETGDLPVQAFAGLGAGGRADGRGASDDRANTAVSGAATWSDEPLDLPALRAFDGELTLNARAIVLQEDLRLEDATLQAALADGVLDLDTLEGTLAGGTVRIMGTADARDQPAAGVRVRAQEVDLGPLLSQGVDFDRISGPLTVTADLNAKGASERALVRSLTGKGRLAGTLTFEAGPQEEAVEMLLGVLGDKVKELRGLTDTSATLSRAFAGEPAALSGTFTVRDGIASTDDTRLVGRGARAVLQGRADLPNWRTDSRIDLFRAGDEAGAPYMTTLLRGSLDAPTPIVRGAPFRPDTRSRAGPAKEGEAAPAQPPEPGQAGRTPSAKDVIQGVLDRLKKDLDQ